MRISVTLQDQSTTGKPAGGLSLEGIEHTITLRDLIRTRVREEVAHYNADPGDTFAGFVMPEGAEQRIGGFLMREPRRLRWETQADVAIESFLQNGFFVIVDDEQVTELDEPLALTADGIIRFVRLVQLVGG